MRWLLFILALVFVSYVFGENSWPFYIIGAILFLIFGPNKKRDRLTGSGTTVLGLSVSPQPEANHPRTVSSQAEEPQNGQIEQIGLVHAEPTSMPAGPPVVLQAQPPEDSEIVQARRTPLEQPKKSRSRRKLLIVGGFLAFVLFVWLSIGHHQEPTPSGYTVERLRRQIRYAAEGGKLLQGLSSRSPFGCRSRHSGPNEE